MMAYIFTYKPGNPAHFQSFVPRSFHIYIRHLNNDKSYLKAHDSISLDVMINYMLDDFPYLCTCNFTVCLSLFHVLLAGGLNHNKQFVLDNRISRA